MPEEPRILGLDPLQAQVVQVICTHHRGIELMVAVPVGHCALEVKMERMLPISRRVHSGLSVLARVVRLPIVLVSLLLVTVFQAGSQDNQALIQEALSVAPPEVAKTATVKNREMVLTFFGRKYI